MSLIDLSIIGENYQYQRTSNFAVKELEDKIKTKYYGGKAEYFMLTGSGMESVTSAIEYLLPKTGKIVIDNNLYAESRLWLRLIDRYNVVKIDMHDLSAVAGSVHDADLVFFDNPNMFQEWFDAKEIVRLSHEAGAKVMVDNSVVSFYFYNPLEDGVDVVVESYSKYIGGHRDVMAGAIVFGYKPENIARLEAFFGWRGRVVHPVTAYMLEQRLETLSLRLEKQQETAKYVYGKLKDTGEDVRYCGRASMMLLMGRNKTEAENLRIFKLFLAYGATFSIATPSYRPDLYTGYGDYLRLSFGLEDKDLLLNDVLSVLR